MTMPFTAADRYIESMLTWQPTNTSATTDQQKGSQDVLIARSRDAWRNQLLAKAIIGRLLTNVIGAGLVLKHKNKEIEKAWEKWIKKCEYEETQNFYSLQKLVFSSFLLSGDSFVNTVIDEKNNLKLQVIEAERVSNSNMTPDTPDKIQGIYLNNGVPYAYSVQTTHPGDIFPIYRWEVINKYGEKTGRQRFFHIWNKERPGQIRGIPLLTVTLEALRKLDRYIDAEMTNAVVANLFCGFVKTEGGTTFKAYSDSTQEEAQKDTSKNDRIFLKPGMLVNLLPGEDIAFSNPNKPASAFEPFISAVMRQIGASVSIPYDVLMMQYNDSYSASRAALMQFWKVVQEYRWQIIEKFCQPIFELWLDLEVLAGRLNLDLQDDSIYSVSWVGPAKGSIDDTKEIVAARERIKTGISSIELEAEEILGNDWYEVHKQREEEQKLRILAGLEKEQEKPIETPLTMEGKANENE